MRHPVFAAIVVALSGIVAANPRIDLTGDWRFALDPGDTAAKLASDQWKFPDKIHLPGSVTAQGFGEVPSIKCEK